MVTHTRNLCSAFNPSKWTQLQSSGQPMLRRPGSSWGFDAMLKGLTSVVVLKVENAHYSLPENSCRTRDSNPQPRVANPTLYPLGHYYLNNNLFLLLAITDMNHDLQLVGCRCIREGGVFECTKIFVNNICWSVFLGGRKDINF